MDTEEDVMPFFGGGSWVSYFQTPPHVLHFSPGWQQPARGLYLTSPRKHPVKDLRPFSGLCVGKVRVRE